MSNENKAVDASGVAALRDWVNTRLNEDPSQGASVAEFIKTLSDKPLGTNGLVVIRDWINNKLNSATAVATDIVEGKTAYVASGKVTGVVPEVKKGQTYSEHNQTITTVVDNQNGSQIEVTQKAKKDVLLRKDAIINSNVSYDDVSSAINLSPDKIKVDESILGVDGIFTADATAVAGDMDKGTTAYVNGEKVTGTVETFGPNTTFVIPKPLTDIEISGAPSSDDIYITGYWKMSDIDRHFKKPMTISASITYEQFKKLFPDLVEENIRAGRAILNVFGTFTADGTATADDILRGKTAYVNGEKVVGAIPSHSLTASEDDTAIGSVNGNSFSVTYTNPSGFYLGEKTFVILNARPDGKMGNATEADVLVGKTFTSENGVAIEGTLVQNPTMSEATDDATATEFDIAKGVTAYAKGEKVTGSVTVVSKDGTLLLMTSDVDVDSAFVNLSSTVPVNKLLRPGAIVTHSISLMDMRSGIGLSKDLIKAGSTILGVMGTFTYDATATADDIASGKTAYVKGEKITGNISVIDSNDTFELSFGDEFGGSPYTNILNNASNNRIEVTFKPTMGFQYLLRTNSTMLTKIPYARLKNLIGLSAAQIKSGETVLGVTGTYSGPTDGTATADDIAKGKTAYAGGSLVTGTVDAVATNDYYSATAVMFEELAQFVYLFKNPVLFRAGSKIYINSSFADVAKAIGLTADLIKANTTILGVKGTFTSDATAKASDILSDKTAYVNGSKITGTIATKTSSDLSSSGATVTVPAGYYASQVSKSVAIANQATPEVSIDTTTGLITASVSQKAGYLSTGVKSGTLQLTTKAAATITPGTSAKTAVSANVYTLGAVTVAGDTDLVASNIKAGVNIFNVDGTFTSDATAVASNIDSGKTAYVNGAKVTGSAVTVMANSTYSQPTYITSANTTNDTSNARFYFDYAMTVDRNLKINSIIRTFVQYSTLVAKIPTLVAGNIKSGVSILGVTGTMVDNPTLSSATSDATAAAGDILSGKTAYVNGSKITGTIVTKTSTNLSASGATITVPAGYYASQVSKSVSTATQATPSVTIDTTTGLITGSATQSAGYVSAGTKSGTLQLTTKAAATITPGTSAKTAVSKNVYTLGAVTVAGDADLVAGNIKAGVNIFDVVGTFTSDGTAVAGNIDSGVIAYVNGAKITGSASTVLSDGTAAYTVTQANTTVSGTTLIAKYPFTVNKHFKIGGIVQLNMTFARVASAIGLTAAQIKSGETVLGIAGTYAGPTGGTAAASDIIKAKTAYVGGSLITGTVDVTVANSTTSYGSSASDISATGVVINAKHKFDADMCFRKDSIVQIAFSRGAVSSVIGLTAAKLKAGESILDLTGTFTSDGTATADDMASGKIAYVNGEKITGTATDNTGTRTITTLSAIADNTASSRLDFSWKASTTNIVRTNAIIKLGGSYSAVATAIGLTAAKIKSGETILGIAGTYTGSTSSTTLTAVNVTITNSCGASITVLYTTTTGTVSQRTIANGSSASISVMPGNQLTVFSTKVAGNTLSSGLTSSTKYSGSIYVICIGVKSTTATAQTATITATSSI